MTEERKKKIKSEIIIWLLSIISIALLAFVISMRRAYINPVLAYHEDTATGNLVSDNIIDIRNIQLQNECGITFTNNEGTITINGTSTCLIGRNYNLNQNIPAGTYSYNDFRNDNSPDYYIGFGYSNGWEFGIRGSKGNGGEKTATTTSEMIYLRFYILEGQTFNNVIIKPMIVNGSNIPNTYEPYGKIYYYSPRSYENKDNVYQETISNIYYEKYSGTNNNVTNKEDFNTINGYLHFNQTINGQDNLSNMKNIYINTEGYYTQNNNLRVVFTNTYSENIQKLSHVEIQLECIQEQDKNNYTNPSNCAMYEKEEDGEIIAITINLKDLYEYNQNGNIQNFLEYKQNHPMLQDGYIYNRITIMFDNQVNSNEIIDTLFYGLEVQKGSNTGTYEVGYNNGYNAAKQRYATSSYTSGYNTGKADGYAEGYNNGISENRGNTLVGLADTILTAPFNMFNTMFDFNFLGVNLRYFILSIITLLIVIWVIKRFW